MDWLTPLDVAEVLAELPEGERRGSRARCILLTWGSNQAVARRLNALVSPFATIDPTRHYWAPRGLAEPAEVELGKTDRFVSEQIRESLMDWWLVKRRRATTPTWDLVATADIQGVEGLVLVEAKAHSNELKNEGKGDGNPQNQKRISAAIAEANGELAAIKPGWGISIDRCYQLSNRFAWSWKLALCGIPVLLVYLGFLRASDVSDLGQSFRSHEDWSQAIRGHAHGLVPEEVWEKPIKVDGTPMIATIRSIEFGLPAD